MFKLEEEIKIRPNVVLNDFTIDIRSVDQGIFFLYCDWAPTIIQLRLLIKSLLPYPEIVLNIFEIEHINFAFYKEKNCIISNGWGETYWIRNGKIIFMKKIIFLIA